MKERERGDSRIEQNWIDDQKTNEKKILENFPCYFHIIKARTKQTKKKQKINYKIPSNLTVKSVF